MGLGLVLGPFHRSWASPRGVGHLEEDHPEEDPFEKDPLEADQSQAGVGLSIRVVGLAYGSAVLQDDRLVDHPGDHRDDLEVDPCVRTPEFLGEDASHHLPPLVEPYVVGL